MVDSPTSPQSSDDFDVLELLSKSWEATSIFLEDLPAATLVDIKKWLFLTPFFESKGYYLYEYSFRSAIPDFERTYPLPNPPGKPVGTISGDPYPYGRPLWQTDEELNWVSLRVSVNPF